MLYMEYIQKAKDMVIEQHDNGKWYLNPEWKYVLIVADMSNFRFKDNPRADWYSIEDNLKLEVEKRNAKEDKLNKVVDWLYETITAQVEPAMLAEETDFVKAATQFMVANHAIEKQSASEEQQQNTDLEEYKELADIRAQIAANEKLLRK